MKGVSGELKTQVFWILVFANVNGPQDTDVEVAYKVAIVYPGKNILKVRDL